MGEIEITNKLFLMLFSLAVFNGLGTNHCVASEYRIGITTSAVFDIFSRSPGARHKAGVRPSTY